MLGVPLHVAVLGAVCVLGVLGLCLVACSDEPGATRGVIVEITDRNLTEIESLTIRDDDGRLWTFATEGALEKDGAHLRLHQVLGQTIEVVYEERDGLLIATGLRD